MMISHPNNRSGEHQKGFTLVETLIAMMVFSIMAAIVGNSFVQSVALQRRGLAAQKIQENALYVLELMAREIRVSTIQTGNLACQNITNYGTTLDITHPVNGVINYHTSGGIVYRNQGGVDATVSSQDVQFTKLYFCVQGSGIDTNQTRVAIIAQVENTTTVAKDKLTFNLQTTVSSRNVTDEIQN